MLPSHIAPDETKAENSTEFIKTLYRVIDDHFDKFEISKEVYSPHNLFIGRAQVVLVLLDEKTSRSREVCAHFQELETQGCKIIGVPMPSYEIKDYSNWWPERMPKFSDLSLFFDCRAGPNGDQWNSPREDKMRHELMPQIHQNLEEWTDRHLTPEAE